LPGVQHLDSVAPSFFFFPLFFLSQPKALYSVAPAQGAHSPVLRLPFVGGTFEMSSAGGERSPPGSFPQRIVSTSFISCKKGILLLRRSDKVSSFQGHWAGVSGSVERNESPFQCAKREILEETALSVGQDIRFVRAGSLRIFGGELHGSFFRNALRFFCCVNSSHGQSETTRACSFNRTIAFYQTSCEIDFYCLYSAEIFPFQDDRFMFPPPSTNVSTLCTHFCGN
jgi:8-oxo-dGTP pyrophosphatase MutT (NUDIX family)